MVRIANMDIRVKVATDMEAMDTEVMDTEVMVIINLQLIRHNISKN
jgi:hypothetical protein